ncbi:MAG: hypothetical protein ACM30G_21250, partial [Micromonosporaceae bacterium]
ALPAAAAPALDASPPDAVPPHQREPIVLFGLALIWLVATMWSAHASIAGHTGAAEVVSTAALVLPAVIAASLVAGSATGLAAVLRWVGGRGLPTRLTVGAAAGAVCGVAAAGLILLGYGWNWAVGLLAITVGVAGTIGGTLAAVRPLAAVAAGTAAVLAQFVVGTLLGYFQSRLKPIFGGGDTIESRLAAANWYALVAALACGVVAGVVAFGYLRRRTSGERWPAYLLAGAWPGLLALLAELLTRVGGGPLLNAVGRLDAASRSINAYLDASRIDSVLVVGFAGAIVAMLAYGRTLRPAYPEDAAGTDADDDAAGAAAGDAAADDHDAGSNDQTEPDEETGPNGQAGPSS